MTMYPEEITQRIKKAIVHKGEQASEAYIDSLTKVEAMDLYLKDYGEKISPDEIRRVILEIFGVNLEGISSLEKLRISLYSKGQWIAQKAGDLFIVYTGANDVDVKIYPTAYFKERTGLNELPEKLIIKLKKLGYKRSEGGALYYKNPLDESVSLTFKDKTIGAIGEIVMDGYIDL